MVRYPEITSDLQSKRKKCESPERNLRKLKGSLLSLTCWWCIREKEFEYWCMLLRPLQFTNVCIQELWHSTNFFTERKILSDDYWALLAFGNMEEPCASRRANERENCFSVYVNHFVCKDKSMASFPFQFLSLSWASVSYSTAPTFKLFSQNKPYVEKCGVFHC